MGVRRREEHQSRIDKFSKKLADHFKVTVGFFFLTTAQHLLTQRPYNFSGEFDGALSDKDWDALRSVAERLKGDFEMNAELRMPTSPTAGHRKN